MKIKLLQPLSIILVMALGLMMTFTACEKEPPEPMDLPLAETLVIDLSQFPKPEKKAAEASIGNWLYSSTSVFIWNAVIVVNMAVPVAAYIEAFNHTPPEYLGDDSWEWSYSVPIADQTYEASLVGTRLNNETFSMEMTISLVGGFQDFKWFEGVIWYNGTEAEWTISHSPEDPTEYLEVHFQKDFEKDIASIKYTVIDPDPDNELFNAYIEYGIDPSYELDAHYTIYKSENTTNIEWNTLTHAGQVMDENFFNDTEWHCWDTQLQDVDCLIE